MKRLGTVALALSLVAAQRARAAETRPAARPTFASSDGAALVVDLFADFITIAAEAALIGDVMMAAPPGDDGALALDDVAARPRASRDSWGQDDPPPWRGQERRRRRDARQGFLFSLGLGGAGLHVSPERGVGAFDFDLRMGYGFSDRFQLFGDLAVDSGQYLDGSSISSWNLTARAQTVLIGDRDGNGLNINAGLGLGGSSRNLCASGYCYDNGYGSSDHSAVGLAAGAGLSYDARLGRSFRLSPEFFLNWHQVPHDYGHAADIATAVGFRINFLWYVQ